MRALIPIAVCAVLGCRNGDTKPPESAAPGKPAPQTSAPPPGAASSTGPTAPTPSAPTPATSEVVIRAKCQKKSCEVEVVNESGSPVQILDLVQAERHDEAIGSAADTHWTPAGVALRVKEQCGAEPPQSPCIEIGKGATLHFPTWIGMTCDPRCPCKANALLKPGEYRFVAQVCGTLRRIESAPFSWLP